MVNFYINISALQAPTFQPVPEMTSLLVVSEVMWALSVPLVKISVGIMTLRLLNSRPWIIFLYVIIGLQVVFAIYLTVMQTTRCIPIEATINPTIPGAKCWPRLAVRASLIVSCVFTIVTDVLFSVIPVYLILRINRSVKERIMIGFLLSLGLFASAASMAKMYCILDNPYASNSDESVGLATATWSLVEEHVGIIAACLPCLKALFTRILARAGIISTPQFVTRTSLNSTQPAVNVQSLKSNKLSRITSASGSEYPASTQDRVVRGS
jgi:hypothetical protein